jgi:hypothetical protein
LKEESQFRIELVGEISASYRFVIVHYPGYLRPNLAMKLQPHQCRESRIAESKSARDMAFVGSVCISASRRKASATPSSRSDKIGGREWRRFTAKAARSCSVNLSANSCTSTMVLMRKE